jgi:hypothetical protein
MVDSGFSAKPKIATFKAGSALSEEVDLHFTRVFGITVSDGWDTAVITLQVRRNDDSVWHDLYHDDGTEYSINVSGGRHVNIRWPGSLFGLRYIRLRSGTSAAPVTQTAERKLNLLTME